MKILHITDSHATIKAPESRTDTYYLTFLKKMYELKFIIKQEGINLIIHTGDLFHSSKVSDRFTGQIAEVIKSFGIPMYVVPGNHDILGYSIDTLNQTKLGLLFKAGVVKELDRDHPIQLNSKKENLIINISGQEYYKDIDTGKMSDYLMQRKPNEPEADLNILCIHGYLCDKPQNPNIPHTMCQSVYTDADIVLSGHFHESFIYQSDDFSAFNPGSMMRVERNTYNKSHIPTYGILDINKDDSDKVVYNYSLHEFRVAKPSEEVFDYSIALEKKAALVSLENFKNSISNTNFNDSIDDDIEDTIQAVVDGIDEIDVLDKPTFVSKALSIYTDAYNDLESEENNIIQQGFIESGYTKYIKKVTMHNFQSHEDTEIEFTDGLNVIIGNSNSGKTSILRAIHWCIDNYPLGSDFIMTGKDDCTVSIEFSDGTIITRSRTRNDAGTYVIIGNTPDGQKYTQTYKGFANSLPIEISDIHQMPKINITKDVSTHLNIMDQLDGPFLITESPANKASIIGRLTGTQYIDEAVKNTNKKVLSINKSIKDDTQELMRDYNTIKSIDAVLNPLAKVGSLITYATVNLNTLSHYIKFCIENNILYREISNRIVTFKLKLLNYKEHTKFLRSYIALVGLVDKKRQKDEVVRKYYNLIDIMNESKAILNNYVQCSNIILYVKLLQEEIAKKILLLKKIEEYNQAKQGHSSKQNTLIVLNKYHSLINFFADELHNKYYKCLKSIAFFDTSLTDCSQMIIKYENEIKSKQEESKDVTKQIVNLVAERNETIQQVGVCPCCGQKLTAKKHITNVSSFMKGT